MISSFGLQGRGLGRMFLRHLRRTRTILHVVDASSGILDDSVTCQLFPLLPCKVLSAHSSSPGLYGHYQTSMCGASFMSVVPLQQQLVHMLGNVL